MKYINNHKFTILVIVIFIVSVVGLYFFYDLFFTNSGKPLYGNRLDGIENVKITNSTFSKLKSSLKENKKVKDVVSNLSGKTIEIVITVDDNVSVSDAKEIGKNTFSSFDEKQVNYYSIQIFIKKDDEKQNNFPIIGYKQTGKKDLVWTKDRKVTNDNEK